jgi:hypothetical protein
MLSRASSLDYGPIARGHSLRSGSIDDAAACAGEAARKLIPRSPSADPLQFPRFDPGRDEIAEPRADPGLRSKPCWPLLHVDDDADRFPGNVYRPVPLIKSNFCPDEEVHGLLYRTRRRLRRNRCQKATDGFSALFRGGGIF